MDAKTFSDWGWRIPFWFSIPLLLISIYIRLKLQESPIFQRMKSQGKRSKQPLVDSFFRYPNNKYVAIALFGATAGQGVVWYTGQFYALFFLLIYLKLDFIPTYILVGLSLVLATPFFLVFGALSDRIGRKKIILAGCLIAALTYFPLFKGLTHFVNPALEAYQQRTPIVVMNALHRGSVSATVLSPPYSGMAKQFGLRELADLRKSDIEYAGSSIAGMGSYIKSQPQLVENFLKGYIESLHFFKTQKEKTLAGVMKFLKMNDRARVEEGYNYYVDMMPVMPYASAAGVRAVLQFLVAAQPKAATASPEEFYDMSLLKKIEASGFTKQFGGK